MTRHPRSFYGALFVVPILALAADAIAQPEFSLVQLPETAGATGSQPTAYAIAGGGSVPPVQLVTGKIKKETGIKSSAVWKRPDNGPWAVELLPADPLVPSVANDIGCICAGGTCECHAVGSEGNPGSEQPVVWGDATGSWVPETVLLPGGFGGGEAKKVVKFRAGVSLAKSVTGVAPDSGGTPKAIVWTRDGLGDWQPTLLPELASVGGAESQANGAIELVPLELRAVSGAAEDNGGSPQPVVWRCDGGVDDCTLTGSWTVEQLPLLAGGTQGEARTGSKAELIEAIAGTSETGGGSTATHAALWTCDSNAVDCTVGASWTVTDLGSLPGLDHSQASGISACSDCGTGMFRILGTAGDPADPNADVAVLWEVDATATPPTVIIFDLNDLVLGRPADLDLTLAVAVEEISLASEGIRRVSGAADDGPHAFVLTEITEGIPTAPRWAMIALALLLVVAAALIRARRRPRTASP